ncbi:hypothetical protein EVAR_102653_1 [Eumeta japonica]|uniref:Uncharacterized protein n=1 Tax=Eumeta variegata TaxID=151549 RepID=A0A4C1TV80_EUMVA|nr:hypothetical protein EVAR_102653_1 [Eumeta japonica]
MPLLEDDDSAVECFTFEPEGIGLATGHGRNDRLIYNLSQNYSSTQLESGTRGIPHAPCAPKSTSIPDTHRNGGEAFKRKMAMKHRLKCSDNKVINFNPTKAQALAFVTKRNPYCIASRLGVASLESEQTTESQLVLLVMQQ